MNRGGQSSEQRHLTEMSVTFVSLTSLVECFAALSEGSLKPDDFRRVRNFLEEVTGIRASHPAGRSAIIPFVQASCQEIEVWLTQQAMTENLKHLCAVARGEASYRSELAYSAEEVQNLEKAPGWFQQLRELGKTLLSLNAGLLEQRGKAGAFFRKIPVDSALGFASLSFLREMMANPPSREKAKFWWGYITGEKPISLTLTVQGLFTNFNFH